MVGSWKEDVVDFAWGLVMVVLIVDGDDGWWCAVCGGGRLVNPDNECWRQINFIPFLLDIASHSSSLSRGVFWP